MNLEEALCSRGQPCGSPYLLVGKENNDDRAAKGETLHEANDGLKSINRIVASNLDAPCPDRRPLYFRDGCRNSSTAPRTRSKELSKRTNTNTKGRFAGPREKGIQARASGIPSRDAINRQSKPLSEQNDNARNIDNGTSRA